MSIFWLGACASLVLAGPGLAADGVVEINQACATQTGCFAGDAPGFPVTITGAAPATSFRLTGDLSVATANDTGILVLRNGVRIDLGGFAIRGPVTCSGLPLVCSASGTGDGIGVDDPEFREQVTVRNGEVSGMGRSGVLLGSASVVEALHASHNAEAGIAVQSESAVRDSAATTNGAWGIIASAGGVIEGCAAFRNKFDGIASGNESVVTRNTARTNGANGISGNLDSVIANNNASGNGTNGITATRGTISGNTVSLNKVDGILCAGTCLITDNAVGSNGATGVGDGIECGSPGCSVRGNTVAHSADRGLKLVAGATYRENTMVGNVAGAVSGGTNLGDNFCNGVGVGSAACP